MKLDLYNMEGLIQSLTRRPELADVAFATGVSIRSISKDGKTVTLEVDGQAVDLEFVQNSEVTIKLPK